MVKSNTVEIHTGNRNSERELFQEFLQTRFIATAKVFANNKAVSADTFTPSEVLNASGNWDDLTDATTSWMDFASQCEAPLDQLWRLEEQLEEYIKDLSKMSELFILFCRLRKMDTDYKVLREKFEETVDGFSHLPHSREAREALESVCLLYPEDDQAEVPYSTGFLVSEILSTGKGAIGWTYSTAATSLLAALKMGIVVPEAA
ncbi:hypothetical protein [Arenibacterium sp. LLYu02]|uniref:hypothetical protein n=1 Tax=Arenibacterium sp. LLYu02 TaxID=3404132 RepID=UPI003B2276B3